MISIKELGVCDYYYLDDTRIFNKQKGVYEKEVSEFRYRLKTETGKRKSITMKAIYRKLFNKVFCIDNTPLLEGEEYRIIEGTNGNYAVSNKGNVKSFIGNYAAILTPFYTPKGYQRVQLYIDGKKHNKFVHVLVCGAFLEPPKSLDYEIHHKRGKADNNVEDLMYISKAEHRKLHSKEKKDGLSAISESRCECT